MMNLAKRFHEKYEPVPESGCWIWTGALAVSGYGSINIGNHRSETAHRVSYMLHKGEIPKGMHICHSCDVRQCVNPSHLFAGSNLDNILDSMSKGRRKGVKRIRPFGLKYRVLTSDDGRKKFRKMSVSDSEAAKLMNQRGESFRSIGRKFGVSYNTVIRSIGNLNVDH